MEIPNLRKKRRSRKRRFSFLLMTNIIIIIILIALAYFQLISPIKLNIYIFSLIILEIFAPYILFQRLFFTLKNYLSTCLFEKKDDKYYPNPNFFTLLAAIITAIISFIFSGTSTLKQNTQNPPINNHPIYNSSNDIATLLKIKETCLTENFFTRSLILDLSAKVFYIILGLNDTSIEKLTNYPLYNRSNIEKYCRNTLKINDEHELNIISDLFLILSAFHKSTGDASILETAELYSDSIINYSSLLEHIHNDELSSQKNINQKYMTNESFYLVYSILKNDEKREKFISLFPERYNSTLDLSIVQYLCPYEKLEVMENLFDGYKAKGWDKIVSLLELNTNLYIKQIKKSHNSLKNYLEKLFNINLTI